MNRDLKEIKQNINKIFSAYENAFGFEKSLSDLRLFNIDAFVIIRCKYVGGAREIINSHISNNYKEKYHIFFRRHFANKFPPRKPRYISQPKRRNSAVCKVLILPQGHDTTAAGSSFFLSMMGIHEHIQEKVVEELDTIFGDSDRPVTFQDTLEMKYLERCILETLRMYPPVPVIARQINEELKLASCDTVLPAGCTVVIGTFKMHRNEVIYPNPTVFNPDNFLPEKTQDRHYYAFVPFSAGPRSCVGRKYAMLKLKIILATILRNYRVKSDLGEKDFRLQADIILKRAEGFKIRLEPRQKIAVM